LKLPQRKLVEISLYCVTALLILGSCRLTYALINPPTSTARLVFIHHSCGSNWLSDDNGGLGIALRDSNYFVSDTNYGWGPDSIGSNTDIGQWWSWFRGLSSPTYLSALYGESGQYSSYSRLSLNPGGENEVIMFKSCYPNSALKGNVDDPVPPIESNSLKDQSCGSQFHEVANAKGIYIDLLEYFKTRQDKLFVVVTAPPLRDSTYAANARAFNNWLVNEWLANYTYSNVFVFDFYNVLTTNGGDANTNDLELETGNHHRWWNDTIQHKTDGDNDADPNILEYPTGDDHPCKAGNMKATAEFVALLNNAYDHFHMIPEFSSATVLSIIMMAVLLTTVAAKTRMSVRRQNRKHSRLDDFEVNCRFWFARASVSSASGSSRFFLKAVFIHLTSSGYSCVSSSQPLSHWKYFFTIIS